MSSKILPPNYRLLDFEKNILFKYELIKKYDTILLILSFNNIESLKLILCEAEKYDLDIVVIDNCSNDGTIQWLIEDYKNKINLIFLEKNIGGAGGFAVGQEYVLQKDYTYCIISEDAAIPSTPNIFNEMLINKKNNEIIQTKYIGLPGQLFTLHFALYPTIIFKKAGVINSKLFFRYDDYEYGLRLNKAALENSINARTIDQYYSHPFLKKGYRIMPIYFSVRNGMLVFSSLGKMIQVFKLFLSNLFFSITEAIKNFNFELLKLLFRAFIDFLYFKESNNQEVLKKYIKSEISPNFQITYEKLTFEEFINLYNSYKIKTHLLKNISPFDTMLRHNKNNRVAILGKFSSPSSIWSNIYKESIFIEEIDLTSKFVHFFKYENNNLFYGRIIIFFALLAFLFLSFLFIPLILVRSFYLFFFTNDFYNSSITNKLFNRPWDEDLHNN